MSDHSHQVDYFVAVVRAGYVCVAVIHRTLAWTTGSLTWAQMLTHVVGHGGVLSRLNQSKCVIWLSSPGYLCKKWTRYKLSCQMLYSYWVLILKSTVFHMHRSQHPDHKRVTMSPLSVAVFHVYHAINRLMTDWHAVNTLTHLAERQQAESYMLSTKWLSYLAWCQQSHPQSLSTIWSTK